MKFAKKLRSWPLFAIFLLVIVSTPAVFALFHKGFFVSDDGEWMIIRLSQFYSTLRFGEFPVRFLGDANNSYGYPSPNFLYPGFLYLGSFIHILRFGFINTIKIEILLFVVSSGIFTFLWLRNFFKQLPALIGALVFVYSPYHLYDAYVRGSVGELMSLAAVSFVLWQIERKSIFWTSLGVGVLLLSHNTLAVVFLPVLLIYSLLRDSKFTATPFVLGTLLSLFFWVPAIYDLQYTVFLQTTISDFANYFATFSQIGMLSILVLFLTALLFATKQKKKYQVIVYYFFVLAVLSLFFSMRMSMEVWHIIPVTFIQFPFRFLSLTILCIAFLTAYSLSQLKNWSYAIAGTIVVVMAFSAYAYITPKSFFQKADAYYFTNQSTTTVKNEYMPIWVKTVPLKRPEQKVQIISGKGAISNVQSLSHKTMFTTNMQIPGILQINTVYFPGWNASVDGKNVAISYNNEYGVMQIPVNSGSHDVGFEFRETPVRVVSDLISIGALVLLVIISFKKKFVFLSRKSEGG